MILFFCKAQCALLVFLWFDFLRVKFALLAAGGLILAADYSQLELRILAHLCHDDRLLRVLNSGTDVFKSIAAEWKRMDSATIGDALRQQAKQVILFLLLLLLKIHLFYNTPKCITFSTSFLLGREADFFLPIHGRGRGGGKLIQLLLWGLDFLLLPRG